MMREARLLRVGIDQGVNLRELRALQRRGLVELRQANELEQTWSDVVQQGKAFMLDHSKLDGPDVLAEDKIQEVERIIGRSNAADIAHIYACYLNRCDYFVTENVKEFINHGRRKALEDVLRIRIRRTQEFCQEALSLCSGQGRRG